MAMKKIALIALCIFITGCGLQRFQNAINRRSAELEKIGYEMELIIPQIIDENALSSIWTTLQREFTYSLSPQLRHRKFG